jgi:bifunctional non-homologous end joining protein LigD
MGKMPVAPLPGATHNSLMPLEEYHTKRQFDSTPEPAGQPHEAAAEPLRFVVQKHAASHLHYDFRLEMDGILRSWAVPKGPSLDPEDKRLAMMTEDHPYDYRNFEGIIPDGNYGAGTVMVWDEGTYEPLHATGDREHDDRLAREGVHKGHLTFILHGTKLRGEFALIKLQHGEDNAWLLVKANKDEFVSQDDVTAQDRSAVTGRTLDEIKDRTPVREIAATDIPESPAGELPDPPKPMLAETSKTAFDDPDWRFEIKWDGYRVMARVTPEGVKLYSRNGQDYSQTFAPVAQDLAALQVPALIDGEVVTVDEQGKSDFQQLQNYLKTGAGRLMYYAFDLPYFEGHDLTGVPLAERQELLRRILPKSDHVAFSEPLVGQGRALFEQAKQAGLEGLMAKHGASRYTPGKRSRDWLKIKASLRQEAVIIGYTRPRGGRQHFGALVLGVYRNGELLYAGHTGTGFDEATLRDLYDRLQPLRRDTCPVTPTPKTNEPATWVEPILVGEISFTEWTSDNLMRHPVFLGLRADKAAQDVVREQPLAPARIAQSAPKSTDEFLELDGHRVKFTHRHKVFWPDDGYTKGDLLDYYLTVADVILPYLRDRPESLNRFPNGIMGASFYQKDMKGDAPEWATTTVVHSDSHDPIEYLVCQDRATLAYMLNLGCVELNPWNSRLSHAENPDWCVIDLDPEAIGFEAVIKTAQTVRDVLGELQIPSYPKTSGATGIHIYMPLGARYDYDQCKLFGQIIANMVHTRLPDITSIERMPKKRQGKIYLDFLQNRRGQTLAAPYAVRPKPGATVSTPLHWDEVTNGLTPQRFTIRNMQQRLAEVGDLWKPVLGEGIDVPAILAKLQP